MWHNTEYNPWMLSIRSRALTAMPLTFSWGWPFNKYLYGGFIANVKDPISLFSY